MTCRKSFSTEFSALARHGEGMTGPRYWRSLEELSETDEFRRLIQREFPSQLPVAFDPLSRRSFLTLMGASLALAGVGGCTVKPAPVGEIVPYVRQPEEVVPGRPLFYATAMTLGGGAVGLLVETHEGRPTKVEGNPDHPASLGATTAQNQASVLELYDPDRSQIVRHLGQARTWSDAASVIRDMVEKQRKRRGAGLRVLTETVVSPTLQAQLEELLKQLPEAKWHVYEPVNCDAAYQAAKSAFGRTVVPRYDFTKADIVVSLDDDFLASGPASLRYAADFMKRRRPPLTTEAARTAAMNRLYVVETATSCTGAKADHRLALKSRDIEPFFRALAAAVGVPPSGGSEAESTLKRELQHWAAAVARDLQAHRGGSIVLAGDRQRAAVHLLAYAMNDHLGNVGKTVEYIEPADARRINRIESLRDLTTALQAGDVECLVILGGNPVLTAPADIPFVAALDKALLRIHLGLYEDETARLCHWHLPEAHFLESWSDARAYDGTASIVQPVIEPLHEGRSVHEVLSLFTNLREAPGRAIVRDTWQKRWKLENNAGEFEIRWQTALHDGVIPDTRATAQQVSLSDRWQERPATDMPTQGSGHGTQGSSKLELAFLPDPAIYDGRFANNGWLQELPKPISKLTWGNAALMSPATASQLGLPAAEYAHGGEHGGYHMPLVELTIDGRTISVPAWIMPGHADDTVTLYLGFGREFGGRVAGSRDDPVGVNAYPLRTTKQPWFASGLQVAVADGRSAVACTQAHHSMEGREPVRSVKLEELRRKPDIVKAEDEHEQQERTLRPLAATGQTQAPPIRPSPIRAEGANAEPLTLYQPVDYSPPKHKWGMSIDLTACIGCSACVVACQAENNIPVVGKDQVLRGREMHWLRVDRYLEGPAEQPDAFHFQPLPCMHCENAPCEYVCPTAATVHSADGLNEMVYNRCVGTRFCSNNCPYKVRRFNFLLYADFESPDRRMQYNPDVTVRSRGVMEKCTYCVQRIRQADIAAQAEGRAIRDGDVVTACQAACPTRAIVFGDLNDNNSRVKQQHDSPLQYALTEELNTHPRTTFLAELRNPNPELAEVTGQGSAG